MLQSLNREAGFQIAFGNQTIFLPAHKEWMKKTLGFASLPHGRFAFIGAIDALKELGWRG
jgi:hypothetical protein